MAPAAQVREVAVVAEGDGAVFQVLNQFRFKRIVGVRLQGLLLGDGTHLEGCLFAGALQKTLFNVGPIGLAKVDAAEVNVVVKTAFNGRANGQVDGGVEVRNGLGHDVGRRVPEGGFAFCVFPGEEAQSAVAGQRVVQFNRAVVPTSRQRILGQSPGNALRYLKSRSSGFVRALGTVGKSNLDHKKGFGTKEVCEGAKVRNRLSLRTWSNQKNWHY